MRQLKNHALHLHYAVPFSRFVQPLILAVFASLLRMTAPASEAEVIGLDALRRERPGITGAGVAVAQAEGEEAADTWQVNPAVNLSVVFRWFSSSGSATNFPNGLGGDSTHAFSVADNFYGSNLGVARGVSRADSYEANYFINDVVVPREPIAAQVINQSFISSSPLDPFYDAFATTYNVLFVSGMNNIADTPRAPGSSYNGIGVGIVSASGQSSVGPTANGRDKPDLVTPHFCCSSYTTPRVAGAAALLLQAGAANDGGPGTASLATNSTVVKALLLNGAVKTTNWTNGVTRPLDARYGAGVLNIYNSDLQLRGRRHVAVATNSVGTGTAHPPTSDTNNVASLRGWDFSSIQSTVLNDRVAHYYFNLPTNITAYSATATLVWKKGGGVLTNLDLFLYDTRSNTLITSSTSAVDNVEHLFIPSLPAGRYDLQVLKRGTQLGAERYALAFDFSPLAVTMARHGTNLQVTWPASPAGFTLEGASSIATPASQWQPLNGNSFLSNAMNTVIFPATTSNRFVRLMRR